MKEKEITEKAVKELASQGKRAWVAIKRTGFAQQDIWGLFDMVYWQYDKVID